MTIKVVGTSFQALKATHRKVRRAKRIYLVRGQRVMLDRDLAELYGVETRTLNQAVRRNKLGKQVHFRHNVPKDHTELEVTNCDLKIWLKTGWYRNR